MNLYNSNNSHYRSVSTFLQARQMRALMAIKTKIRHKFLIFHKNELKLNQT